MNRSHQKTALFVTVLQQLSEKRVVCLGIALQNLQNSSSEAQNGLGAKVRSNLWNRLVLVVYRIQKHKPTAIRNGPETFFIDHVDFTSSICPVYIHVFDSLCLQVSVHVYNSSRLRRQFFTSKACSNPRCLKKKRIYSHKKYSPRTSLCGRASNFLCMESLIAFFVRYSSNVSPTLLKNNNNLLFFVQRYFCATVFFCSSYETPVKVFFPVNFLLYATNGPYLRRTKCTKQLHHIAFGCV